MTDRNQLAKAVAGKLPNAMARASEGAAAASTGKNSSDNPHWDADNAMWWHAGFDAAVKAVNNDYLAIIRDLLALARAYDAPGFDPAIVAAERYLAGRGG